MRIDAVVSLCAAVAVFLGLVPVHVLWHFYRPLPPSSLWARSWGAWLRLAVGGRARVCASRGGHGRTIMRVLGLWLPRADGGGVSGGL